MRSKTRWLIAGLLLTSGIGTMAWALLSPPSYPTDAMHRLILPTDSAIAYTGRIERLRDEVRFSWSGVRIEIQFTGTTCALRMGNSYPNPENGYPHNVLEVQIDGQAARRIVVAAADSLFTIANDLPAGAHHLRITKLTEAGCGRIHFRGLVLDKDAQVSRPPHAGKRLIEFIGDSITAGYGTEATEATADFSPETENVLKGYAAQAAALLNADATFVCVSGRGLMRNYNGTTEGLIPELYPIVHPADPGVIWDFSDSPHAVVINVGTNDMASGMPLDEAAFAQKYAAFVAQVRAQRPGAVLYCVDGPMLTATYPTNRFSGQPMLSVLRRVITETIAARQQQGDMRIHAVSLSPQGKLGYGADYHPSAAQHRLNGEELAQVIGATW